MSDQSDFIFFNRLNNILNTSVKTDARLGRVFAALALSLLIAACGSGQKEDIDLQGQLTTANDGALSETASARISLVQQRSNDSERRIVAERTLHDLGKRPIKFDLTIGRGLLQKDAQYGLSAEIHDSKGNVSWQTPVAQAVQPFADDRQAVLLMLQKKTDADHEAPITYSCAEQFEFTATNDTEQATVHLGRSRQLSLKAEPSGHQDTARYVDEHDNALLIGKKDNNKLSVDGTTHDNCQVVPTQDTTQSESSDNKRSAAPSDQSEQGAKSESSQPPSDTDSQKASEASGQS